MFTRIANGWELAKESFNVLRMDKELLVFPLVSGLSCLLVLASFGLPLWNSEYAATLFQDGQAPQDPLAYVLLFAFYLVNYFVIVFFNTDSLGDLADGKLELGAGIDLGAGSKDAGVPPGGIARPRKGRFIVYQLSETGVSASLTVNLTRYSVLDLSE